MYNTTAKQKPPTSYSHRDYMMWAGKMLGEQFRRIVVGNHLELIGKLFSHRNPAAVSLDNTELSRRDEVGSDHADCFTALQAHENIRRKTV